MLLLIFYGMRNYTANLKNCVKYRAIQDLSAGQIKKQAIQQSNVVTAIIYKLRSSVEVQWLKSPKPDTSLR